MNFIERSPTGLREEFRIPQKLMRRRKSTPQHKIFSLIELHFNKPPFPISNFHYLPLPRTLTKRMSLRSMKAFEECSDDYLHDDDNDYYDSYDHNSHRTSYSSHSDTHGGGVSGNRLKTNSNMATSNDGDNGSTDRLTRRRDKRRYAKKIPNE